MAAELPLPDTGSPAASDPVTAVLLTATRRRVRGYCGLSALILIGLLTLAVELWRRDGASVAPILVLVVLGYVGYRFVQLARFFRRSRVATRLLSAHAWRPVPATVITGRVVELRAEPAAGRQVRVLGLRRVTADVIARTGRVWVVGPDDPDGPLVLRTDGAPNCYLARPARRTRPPRWSPTPPGSTGTALDDPVFASALKRASTRFTVWLCLALGFTGLSLLYYRLGSTGYSKDLGSFLYPLAVVLLLISFMRWRGYRQLVGLFRAGPWTRVSVTIESWQPRPNGCGAVRGTVQPAHGMSLTITLAQAPIALYDAMARTGTVWLAGDPRPGRVLVGYPGYPLLGIARLLNRADVDG